VHTLKYAMNTVVH